MKKRLNFASVLFNIVAVLIIGVFLAPFVGKLTAFAVMAVLFTIPFLGYWAKSVKRDAVLYAGLLKEIWTTEFKDNFYILAKHLERSEDMSSLVNNNIINLAEAGIDPNVLINNSIFPIATVAFSANAIALPLRQFDTENTSIKNAIKKQYMFDAMRIAVGQHKKSMIRTIGQITTHSWAPNADGVLTPVIAATGAVKTTTARRRITLADIAAMQVRFDLAGIPDTGRVLVLHPQHKEDLLNEDRTLFKQFAEHKSGTVFGLYGFDIYVYALNPIYTTAGVKKAFGSLAVPATDCYASIVYHEDEVMRAEGTLDMFFLEKALNPSNREDVIGFQQFYTGMSIRNKALGAIYSGT